jgi:hypothetical protein
VALALDVCDDWALRSWVLGFGPRARVLVPAALAERIQADLEQAAGQYADRMAFAATADLQDRLQRVLPFWTERAIS